MDLGTEPQLLQPIWDTLRALGEPYVAHWLFPAWVGFASFTVTCLYFTYKDLVHDARTKIHKDRWPTPRELLRAGAPQFVLYLAGNVLGFYLAPYYVELPDAAPGVVALARDVLLCLIASDFLIYWEHRLMHAVPVLRRRVHAVHHAYAYPFSWAGGWVHPLEDLVVIVCVALPPVALGVHPLTFWVFVALWVACLVEEHSGHDVWWSPYRWLPGGIGGGGAPHDPHHNVNVNMNYGFVLTVWDRLFGTFLSVEEAAARRAGRCKR